MGAEARGAGDACTGLFWLGFKARPSPVPHPPAPGKQRKRPSRPSLPTSWPCLWRVMVEPHIPLDDRLVAADLAGVRGTPG